MLGGRAQLESSRASPDPSKGLPVHFLRLRCHGFKRLGFSDRNDGMLRAYLDESGHSADPNITNVSVCGVVASHEQWAQFEPKWEAVLQSFGVAQLHMRDFAHSQGEYREWNEKKRKEFLGRLFKVVNAHSEGNLAATMPLDLFRSLTTEQQAILGGDPYYPCFLACIIGGATCALHLGDQIDFVVSEAPGFIGKAVDFYDRCKNAHAPADLRDKLAGMKLGTPQTDFPLQFADLVAYEVNKFVTVARKTGDWIERWPFAQLKERMLTIELFDPKTMNERFGF